MLWRHPSFFYFLNVVIFIQIQLDLMSKQNALYMNVNDLDAIYTTKFGSKYGFFSDTLWNYTW